MPLECGMQDLSLEAGEETEESQFFRRLSRAHQRRLLHHYPRVLANAAMCYSSGADCEQILRQQLADTPETLSCTNDEGDNVVANSLVQQQAGRAAYLVELAASKNIKALQHRSAFSEDLLMLSTMLGDSSRQIVEMLMNSDPTQLHRHHDSAGRNLLHHCAEQVSIEPLRAVLQLTDSFLSSSDEQQRSSAAALSRSHVRAAIHMNDTEGDTPMHVAARRDRGDMLRLLSDFSDEHGLDVDFDEAQHRGDRRTPLMVAVASRAERASEFLLSNGLVDAEAEDRDGRRAADLADGADFRQKLEAWQRQFDEQLQQQQQQQQQLISDFRQKDSVVKASTHESVPSCGTDRGYESMEAEERVDQLEDRLPEIAESSLTQAEMEIIDRRLADGGQSQKQFIDRLGLSPWQLQLVSVSQRPVFTALSLLLSERRHQLRETVLLALRDIGASGSDLDLLLLS